MLEANPAPNPAPKAVASAPAQPAKEWKALLAPLKSAKALMKLGIAHVAEVLYDLFDGIYPVMTENIPSVGFHTEVSPHANPPA